MRIFWVFLLGLLLCEGCADRLPTKSGLGLARGWKMLDFPRDEFLPGTVFSSDAQNEFLIYGNFGTSNQTVRESISIPVTDFALKKDADFKAAISFLAAGTSASVEPAASRSMSGNVSLHAQGAESLRLNNLFETLPAIQKTILPKMSKDTRGQKFYVVVESVAVRQLDYKFDEQAYRCIGGGAAFGAILKANAHLEAKTSESRALSASFDPPRFILFQARKLEVENAGLDGGAKLTVRPTDEQDLPQLLGR